MADYTIGIAVNPIDERDMQSLLDLDKLAEEKAYTHISGDYPKRSNEKALVYDASSEIWLTDIWGRRAMIEELWFKDMRDWQQAMDEG